MKRAIILLLLCSTAFGQLQKKQIQFVDEWGKRVNLGTDVSIYVYQVGTTTERTCYKDLRRYYTCTQPITDDSANTPFVYDQGLLVFYSSGPTFKLVVTDGTYTRTLDNLTASDTQFLWPSFIASLDDSWAAIGSLSKADGTVIVGDGTTWTEESGATLRTTIGVGTTDSPTFAGLTVDSNTLSVYMGELLDDANEAELKASINLEVGVD